MKEKTVKSYQEPGIRLQLVRVENPRCPFYQIRENRKIMGMSVYIEEAVRLFNANVYKHTNQLKLEI